MIEVEMGGVHVCVNAHEYSVCMHVCACLLIYEEMVTLPRGLICGLNRF